MCFCELLLDSLENFSEKLTSQEYKDFVELIARQHGSCVVRNQMKLPPTDEGDRSHTDMISYWLGIRDRSSEWIAYAEQNLRILTGNTPSTGAMENDEEARFSDILRFWKRIDDIRNS